MSDYLKIVIQNLEPLRISDDSVSQSGQTATLRYIPGSAFRGIVVNALALEPDFEQIKKVLFSPKIRYLNAYPSDGGQELLPSPKGFYEDKTVEEGKKELHNVVLKGEFPEGYKRASVGRFCRIEDGCIYYYQVDTGSDLKIKINLEEGEKQNVFRNEYITAGHQFTGYIAVDDENLKERISNVFHGDIIIGNGRSAGLGKCRVLFCDYIDGLPYQDYMAKEDQADSCYMLLLSHTAMRNKKGELCGLDCGKLEEQMGVEGLEIKFCSTSTVEVKGYSRIWDTMTPSVTMYEQGSVFHLQYHGTLTKDRIQAICEKGIGIQANAGFGRVLFLDRYEELHCKEAKQFGRTFHYETTRKCEGDEETLKIVAKRYYQNCIRRAMVRYVVKNVGKLGKIPASQLGTAESIAAAYRYNPKEAKAAIQRYLGHALEKEANSRVQKEKSSMQEFDRYISQVFGMGLEELLELKTAEKDSIMGIEKKELVTPDETDKLRLELVIRMIRYANKEEGR